LIKVWRSWVARPKPWEVNDRDHAGGKSPFRCVSTTGCRGAGRPGDGRHPRGHCPGPLSTADLRRLGAQIGEALCVIDREQGGGAALAADGITLSSLLTATDLHATT
jgi:hypothetical protein